ncbi:type I polyketide synthase, partial [bacterium]|nr:type I polyketide synthase [bacterium]
MSSIAVVGMACRYPDAASPEELWENVLSQRRAFRRWPEQRLRSADYLSADGSDPDSTYCTQAAVIEGYEFDRARFRVVGSTYRAVDPVHWLALDVAAAALVSAGFGDGADLPRETTGVLVGNSLTGEFSRANVLRLRWPYVRRTVEAELIEAGWPDERRAAFLGALEDRYKAPFPEVGEESLAGGLSNTIAGRICNHFDLHGGGFTVDAACASSLLAIAQSCSALAAGDLDVALAGGVDLSLDPFEIIGFSRLGALARDDMRVFDERSAGFWPGEGCGFVVLMREEDARALGRPVLAKVRGWGISSDGSGGITRPEVEGQLLAVKRAWRRSGLGVDAAVYVEGHGTGTEVGDRTELSVLRRALADTGTAHPLVIGSVKANIGHTKAAAGVAGFLKMVQALRHGVVPPTTGCHTPHSVLEPGTLETRRGGGSWPAERPLVAASSSMGFGGINVHIVAEGESRRAAPALTDRERTLLRSAQDCELLLFSAETTDELQATFASLRERIPLLSRAELGDLGAHLAGRVDPEAAVRAAIVAATAEEAAARLAALTEQVTGMAPETGAALRSLGEGIFIGSGPKAARLGFLFPGQGSPVHPGGGIHARRFDRAWEIARKAGVGPGADTIDTRFAQPAIVAASAAALRVLRDLGVDADVAAGHSLGELCALHCAGVLDEDALLAIATARGIAMADLPGDHGAMAGVPASVDDVQPLLAGTALVVAGRNAPRRTVVAGPSAEIDAFVAAANERGWRAVRIAVSHAFHSPLVADAAPVLGARLEGITFHPPRLDVASTITGGVLAPDEDVARLLLRQITHPVRFTDAVRSAGDVDLWIEVGPGAVLSGLLAAQGDDGFVAPASVPVDAGSESLRGFLNAVGAAWALGRVAHPEALFADRFVRPFDPARAPTFFANPCEEAPPLDAAPASASRARRAPTRTIESDPDASIEDVVRRLVADRTELPPSLVEAGHRMLSDLHLNSI